MDSIYMAWDWPHGWPEYIEDGPDDPPVWEVADLIKLLAECDVENA